MSDRRPMRSREDVSRQQQQSREAQARQETIQPREGEEEIPARVTVTTWHAQTYIMNEAGDAWELHPDAVIDGGPPPEVVDPVAPTVVDTPAVSGPDGLSSASVGQTLNCTMGNWNGEPTSYTYQWQSDSSPVGSGTASYMVAGSDSGKSITCVVTATNAVGSATAPPSNAVVVA
jgi:hypothetical protein